jgi:predicted RNA binding protein YcfA (HicA-like mRNA interferase family)
VIKSLLREDAQGYFGCELVKLIQHFGYTLERQKGSHMKLTTTQKGEHHLIVPRHGAIRVGTLHRIVSEVAGHFGIEVSQVRAALFGDKN